jgi:prolyl 4-hydroxylase
VVVMRDKDKEREERRAAALRQNLSRRKIQARSLKEGAAATGDSVEDRANGGDACAQLEVAMALLVKARTAPDLQRAVDLIEAASGAGHARASEQCALLECVGIGRPVNWTKALDRLQQAAEQGSTSAARQLMLFANSDAEPLPAGSSPSSFWGKIRRSIDEQAMLAPREGQIATERPYVGVFQKFASAAECRWLIDTARERLGPSTVFDYSTGGLRADPRRTSRAAMLPFDLVDPVIEMMRARISSTLALPLPRFEVSQVLHYGPGQEFKPHHDYFDPSAEGFQEEISVRGQRVATLIIYLNDEFTGGETRFPSLGFNYRGSTGDAIAFSSVDPDGRVNPLTLHAGLPPASGEKWIFSQWVRDKAAAGQAV